MFRKTFQKKKEEIEKVLKEQRKETSNPYDHSEKEKELYKAVKNGNLEKTIILLEKEKAKFNALFEKGIDILEIATREQHENIIEYIIFSKFAGFFLNPLKTSFVFQKLIQQELNNSIKLFLNNEELRGELNKTNIAEVLNYALQNNEIEIIDLVLSNDRLFGKLDDQSIKASLIYAISNSNLNAVNFVLNNTLLFSQLKSESLSNIFSMSVIRGENKITEMFLQNSQIIQAIKNSDPILIKTTLQIACKKQNIEIINLINNDKDLLLMLED